MQKKKKKGLFSHIMNVITIALIVECFLCAIMAVNKYGKESCFDRIEETTNQVALMFSHAMQDNVHKLECFAETLAVNENNTDAFLEYMLNYLCHQGFAEVSILRPDDTQTRSESRFSQDDPPLRFEDEKRALPYTSGIISKGDTVAEKYIYRAVPVLRDGQIVAILYGYMSLETFPQMIDCTAYDGKCTFYIVEGSTGDFLMGTYRGTLGNIYDEVMDEWEAREGYDIEDLRTGVRTGKSGYFVFRSRDGLWNYTYYMPLTMPSNTGNWSIQLTVDEPTAFAAYYEVSHTIVILSVIVVVLMFIHVLILMLQNKRINDRDKNNLHQSQYVNEVQRVLLNAHTNPDIIVQALKLIAREVSCETVMLLSFNGKQVSNAFCWPSVDRLAAKEMLGRNVQESFPVIYDSLAENKSVLYSGVEQTAGVSPQAMAFFSAMDIRNCMVVPVMDNAGLLRGAICAVNLEKMQASAQLLECVTYDFFMTLTNVENLEIIRNLGTMDYMTGVKNRNSYEAELANYAAMDAHSLWCVYVDVNGLHAMNNKRGHKAGDLMLCTVADVLKKKFGKACTYRIGGDEFLAFACDSSFDVCMKNKKEIVRELAQMGYHVSVGFEAALRNEHGLFDVECAVANAETIMYRDKKEFYQKRNITSERDFLPEI